MKGLQKRIHLAAPHMTGKEDLLIKQAFETNWIAPLGPNVDGFEKKIADYVGVKRALALNSGTSAIHLALKLLGIKRGDRVFCSTFTFVATANPILYEGAEPVFIDSEWETWNMSPVALKKAFEAAARELWLPKAVIVVNLYGQSADMDEILGICEHYGVPVIEDAAESLGATYKGRKSGTFGKFGIYSFNGNKIITTSGGGMLVSDDEEAMERAEFLATQAKEKAPYYQHEEMGYNYRMSNILAGIGIVQMDVIDTRVMQKREIYKRYEEAFTEKEEFLFVPEVGHSLHTRWLTSVLLGKRAGFTPMDLVEALALENIEARPVWKPLHLQPLFKQNSYFTHEKNYSVSDELFSRGICLPSGTGMSEEDQMRVIQNLLSYSQSRKLHKVLY